MTIDQNVFEYISGIIYGLCDLGHLLFSRQRLIQAQEYYQKSLAICRQYGLEPDRAVLFYLCLIALYQNNFSVASQRFIALYQYAEEKYKKRDLLNLLSGLAAVAGCTNQPDAIGEIRWCSTSDP